MAVSGLKGCGASGVEVPAKFCCYTTWVAPIFAVAQPLAALLPYGCGTPLAGAALPAIRYPSAISVYYRSLQTCFCLRGGIASLAAVGTIENARISDRRKLVCTKTQYAERQRLIEAEASHMSTHPMAASEAMPPRRHFHCPARAASLTCKLAMRAFLLGDIKGAVLFREREPPPLPVQSRRRCFSPSALCREFLKSLLTFRHREVILEQPL